MRILLIIILLLLPVRQVACAAKTRTAELISVHDGDTITVRDNGKKIRIRLLGIDAPELAQEPWGFCARRKLCTELGSALCSFKNTKIKYEYDVQKKDKYKRDLAYIYNAQNELVNETLLKDGYAVVLILEPNTKYAIKFKDAEAYARKKNIAIWSKSGLKLSPYEFRKRESKRKRS